MNLTTKQTVNLNFNNLCNYLKHIKTNNESDTSENNIIIFKLFEKLDIIVNFTSIEDNEIIKNIFNDICDLKARELELNIHEKEIFLKKLKY